MHAAGLVAGGYATVSTKVQVYEGSGANVVAKISTDS